MVASGDDAGGWRAYLTCDELPEVGIYGQNLPSKSWSRVTLSRGINPTPSYDSSPSVWAARLEKSLSPAPAGVISEAREPLKISSGRGAFLRIASAAHLLGIASERRFENEQARHFQASPAHVPD